jgi:hypothetical protein
MKIVTTLLSAVLIAGASTVALAQSGSAGTGDLNPNQIGRGADENPSAMNANPMAGNRGNSMQADRGAWLRGERMNGMNAADVSGRWNDQSWNNGRSDRRNGW